MSDTHAIESLAQIEPLTNDELVDKLNALGVYFLHGGDEVRPENDTEIDPKLLLTGLTTSNEARMRLALIPLLLQRPDYAESVTLVLPHLSEEASITIRCYYTAAVFLQKEYYARLEKLVSHGQELPDLFSQELGLSVDDYDPQKTLKGLANCHAKLSGLAINWLGTYHHAVQQYLRFVEHRQLWHD